MGVNCGESKRQSLIDGEMVIVGVVKPVMFKTAAEYGALDFAERKAWDRRLDTYLKMEAKVTFNIHKTYSNLWSLCHIGLQQKIKSDLTYKDLVEGDAPKLFALIKKICNGGSSSENPFMNLMDS